MQLVYTIRINSRESEEIKNSNKDFLEYADAHVLLTFIIHKSYLHFSAKGGPQETTTDDDQTSSLVARHWPVA